MSELSAAELGVLRDVAASLVAFSRGRYFLLRAGQRSAPAEIHTVRARGLVVLAQVKHPPPTRLCELTDKGRAVLAQEERVCT